MSRNRINKKISEFEFSFNDISFCNDLKLKPFIETFVQEPENINQQSLGTIFGIFEVTDTSEDSSYITNYLISVIKKEYFSKPKRGAIESFEASLHKANLALSKLAEHGNVAWIGKINILCAALEKYNLHLTRIGSCHAFLLREKGLTDISEELSSAEGKHNPLKTFTDVSSGKIQENDKIIISTDNILDIFSTEEIKKSANKFPEMNFIRFLKTALVNELPRAATLVVDVKKKKEKLVEKPQFSPAEFNAFSNSSFTKSAPKKPLAEKLKEEIKEELEKSSKEIKCVKPGHIYIKEAENLPQAEPFFILKFFSNLLNSLSDKISGFQFFAIKNFFKSLRSKISDSFASLFFKIKSANFKQFFSKINWCAKNFYLKYRFSKPSSSSTEITRIFFEKSLSFFKKNTYDAVQKIFAIFKRPTAASSVSNPEIITPPSDQKLISENPETSRMYFLPNFSKIKRTFSAFSYEQKIYAIAILLLIFVIPYLGIKIENKITEKKAAETAQNTPQKTAPLEQDKNVIYVSNLTTIAQDTDVISKTISLNGKIFFVGSSGIFDLEKNQLFPFPTEIGNLQTSAGMNDLNLILLATKDKKVFSFSPISKKFQSNSIEIPDNTDMVISGTYLTYLYLLDKKNSQIYRYPRAEGGFGAKVDWLKDALNLSEISDMSISENIFLVRPNEVIKLFKGKRQDFSVSETSTPIHYDYVHIATNNPEIFILDKINSRIVRLSPEGNIINQFYNEKIKEAGSFTISEEQNMVYFSVNNIAYSFGF